MNKENQSLIDFLGNAPMASFVIQRSSLSNKEAQVLYDIWKQSNKDEYGKHIVDNGIDPFQVVSLTSKGYVRNIPTRFGGVKLLEFTNKGKEVIKKIILHQETSAFEKQSQLIDYEAICRQSVIQSVNSGHKVASKQNVPQNWLGRIIANIDPYSDDHMTFRDLNEEQLWMWRVHTNQGLKRVSGKTAEDARSKAVKHGLQVLKVEPARSLIP